MSTKRVYTREEDKERKKETEIFKKHKFMSKYHTKSQKYIYRDQWYWEKNIEIYKTKHQTALL